MPDRPQTTASFGALAMPRQCRWCGMIHGPQCPSVKAIELYSDGTVKRVEFFAPKDYPAVQTTIGSASAIVFTSGSPDG